MPEYRTMEIMWRNEKYSPEVTVWNDTVVSGFVQNLEAQETMIESGIFCHRNHRRYNTEYSVHSCGSCILQKFVPPKFVPPAEYPVAAARESNEEQQDIQMKMIFDDLLRLNVHRMRYLFKEFLRLRVRKIQAYALYYHTDVQAKQRLSEREQALAQELWKAEEDAYQANALAFLPKQKSFMSLQKDQHGMDPVARPKMDCPVSRGGELRKISASAGLPVARPKMDCPHCQAGTFFQTWFGSGYDAHFVQGEFDVAERWTAMHAEHISSHQVFCEVVAPNLVIDWAKFRPQSAFASSRGSSSGRGSKRPLSSASGGPPGNRGPWSEDKSRSSPSTPEGPTEVVKGSRWLLRYNVIRDWVDSGKVVLV